MSSQTNACPGEHRSVREAEDVRDHIAALQEQVTDLKVAVDQARRETSQQMKARVEQVKADLSRQANSAGYAGG